MTEELANVKTGQVTYAVRDTHIDDKEIKEGNIMGIGDHAILAVGEDVEQTTLDMFKELIDEDSELISIYYGEDVKKEDADKLGEDLSDLYPDCDIEVHFGGQPDLLLCSFCGVENEYSFPNYSLKALEKRQLRSFTVSG